MIQSKPMLFRLLVYFLVLTCFIVVILSVVPYVMIRDVFTEQIINSETKATVEANEKLLFLLEDLEGLADRVFINTAVQEQLRQNEGGYSVQDSVQIKDVFSNSRPLYKLNQYDAYIFGFNGYQYRYSYTASYETNLSFEIINESEWYKEIYDEKGKCVLINGSQTKVERMYDKIIFGRIIIDTNNGGPVGIFLLVFDKTVIDDIYSSLSNDKYGTFYVIDEKEQQITTISDAKLLDQETLSKVKKEHTVLLDKERKQIISTDVDGTNWKVIEILSLEFLSEITKVLRIVIVMLSAVILIVVAAISYLLLNKLYRPINQLQKAMTEVEKGNFNITFLEIDKDNEINQLNKSFLKMATALENSFRKLCQEQREKREAEIKMLQAQIKPHFLYNTLTSVRVLIRTGKKTEADNMIISLIKLLKNTFDTKEMVTIGEEINILKCYSVIYQYRYQNFRLEIDIDEGILNCLIPKLLLQPLVENSIVHNLEDENEFVVICVRGRADHDRLYINVEDNGEGIPEHIMKKLINQKGQVEWDTDSIGLQNIQNRIKCWFGDDYGLYLISDYGKGVKVCLEIPILYGIEGEI